MKTMEESAHNTDAREKALKNLDTQARNVVMARARVSQTQEVLKQLKEGAGQVVNAEIAELEAECSKKILELEAEYIKSINSAKSGIGTAEAELAKITQRYAVARTRLIKLLPPENIALEPKTNGATDDRSPASVG